VLIALIVAAILAVAVVGSDADALNDGQGHPPEERSDPPTHPPVDRPADCMEEGMVCYAPPERPPVTDRCMPEEPPSDGPVIVFDASGIPAHAPEKIKGFADAVEKREKMDERHGSFFIYDPSSKDTHDDALSKALEAMGFHVISDLHELDNRFVVVKLSWDNFRDSHALYKILQSLEAEMTELGNLIYNMIVELDSCSNDDKSAALTREDEVLMLDTLVSDEEDDEDSGSDETFYVVLAAPSAVETYLSSHGFDGGAIILQ